MAFAGYGGPWGQDLWHQIVFFMQNQHLNRLLDGLEARALVQAFNWAMEDDDHGILDWAQFAPIVAEKWQYIMNKHR